jgi:hypothetical protein
MFELVSTILTLFVVLLIYYIIERKKWEASPSSKEGIRNRLLRKLKITLFVKKS